MSHHSMFHHRSTYRFTTVVQQAKSTTLLFCHNSALQHTTRSHQYPILQHRSHFQLSCYPFSFRPIHRVNGPTMDHTPDCDEQSEVLFVFTEDAADNQSPPATSPPPTATPLPHITESADQAFWSGVYTLDPPHALMGVLTDLRIHRFLLHQHLTTLKLPLAISLSPTPYRNPSNVSLPSTTATCSEHNITHALLNAIDSLARFPPAAYFTDPNLSTSDPQHPPHEAFSAPSGLQPGQPIHIPPIRRYPLPTASNTGTVVQHVVALPTHQEQPLDLPPLAAPHAASEPRPHHALLPQPGLATPTPARGTQFLLDPSSFAHAMRFTVSCFYSDFNSAFISTAVPHRGCTTFSHQHVHISGVLCGLNILACSSNRSRSQSLEFQPPLHHGRTVAAVLLEPLPHAAATTSAADLHRCRHHKPFHQPPFIQPYWHLWSPHPRSSHSPHAPHTTLHTIAAAQSIPADSTFTARISATATPATPHHGASHPARPIFQTQPTAISQAHRSRLLAPN